MLTINQVKHKMPSSLEGRLRVVIEQVTPEVDGERYPIKRIVGESISVEAILFADGHDELSAALLYRNESEDDDAWRQVPMQRTKLDHWTGSFRAEEPGQMRYVVEAWVDPFLTWRRDLRIRLAAEQNIDVDMLIGLSLFESALAHANFADRDALKGWLEKIGSRSRAALAAASEDPELYPLMLRCLPRENVTRYSRELSVIVDRPLAGCSAWYELFPRSAALEPGRHGTLKDVEARLPYIAAMGFDVVYLPPIHPIGRSFRKGPNNSSIAGPDDVGSPWAIGSEAGGHDAIHPELGTLDDFDQLNHAAREHGLEIAMDIAFQCSPDHPYVKQHPEWFRSRPDGSIQYAENPPKKYQDIYPFDFETSAWRELWDELARVFVVWIERGIRIFRVDNPHTKAFPFWEWCIANIKQQYPDVIFLAEAFTRPQVMQHLAKIGFTQSYTYFAWRNTKEELTQYMAQLCDPAVSDFLRPNFWPNTPDILPEYLQYGGRAAFLVRLVLAATLSPNYGIYGPPFEHCWSQSRDPGSEEYLDSEKYQLHTHNWKQPDSLVYFIARVNQIRREHRALQSLAGLTFHHVDNPQVICYSKATADRDETLLCLVNLDPHHLQSGWVDLPLAEFGLDPQRPYQLHDLLSEARYLWQGATNFVELNPAVSPAHIFRLRRRVRQEQDFEYYL